MPGVLTSWVVMIFESFYGSVDIVGNFKKFNNIILEIVKDEKFRALSAALSAAGLGMLLLYLILHLADTATARNLTISAFFSSFVKFVIAAAFFVNILAISAGLLSFGTVLASRVEEISDDQSRYFRWGVDEINNQIDEANNALQEDFQANYRDQIERLKNAPGSKYTEGKKSYYITVKGKYMEDTLDDDGNVQSTKMISPAFTDHTEYGTNYERLSDGIEKMDIATLLFTAIKVILPYLCVLVEYMAVLFICISRTLEISIRLIFAPIATADIFTNGADSSGFRYMKKFLAYGLQLVVIIAICYIFGAILQSGLFGMESADSMTTILAKGNFSTSACEEFIDKLVSSGGYAIKLVMQIVKIYVIVKAMQWCNEIVGV